MTCLTMTSGNGPDRMGIQKLYTFYQLEDRAQAEALIADKISAIVRSAISERGQASLMLSGGRSPRQMYQELSEIDLQWDKVTIGLVDDRWVAPNHVGSNERLLRETLLQNRGRAARFLGLKTRHNHASDAVKSLNEAYCQIGTPFDLCLMGMGTDGHTASWFPGSRGLAQALDINNSDLVCAIDATGCPGAGDYPSRMTLSLPAVMNSRHIFLYITGQEKSDVFQVAIENSVDAMPVKALLAAGARLSVFWAP